MKTFYLFFVLLFYISVAKAEYREYLLGDIDNFTYGGPGSIDDIYVDPAWQEWGNGWARVSYNDFDIIEQEQMILFTFCFNLEDEEQIINANLTVGMQGASIPMPTEILVIDSFIRGGFNDFGWQSVSDQNVSIRTFDFLDSSYSNYIYLLDDGMMNVAIIGDIGVDYAILGLEVIPEPCTMGYILIGLMYLRKKRKHICRL